MAKPNYQFKKRQKELAKKKKKEEKMQRKLESKAVENGDMDSAESNLPGDAGHETDIHKPDTGETGDTKTDESATQ